MNLENRATIKKEEVKKEEEKQQVTKIYVTQKKFEKTHAVSLLTSQELIDMINDMFMKLFGDYYGARIRVENGEIKADIAFTPSTYGSNDPDKLMAIEDSFDSKNSTNSLMTKIERFNGSKMSGSKYRLTQDAKEGLAKFVNKKYRINGFVKGDMETPRINWGNAAREECIQGYYNGVSTQIIIKIEIDIEFFVNSYFSHRNDEGHKCVYMINVQRPLGMNPQMMQPYAFNYNCTNYAFVIYQIDEENSTKKNAAIGGAPVANNLGFVPVRY